jgi:hypothetical protein
MATLTGVNTQGSAAYLLLLWPHVSPTTLALLLNGTLRRLRAKVISDDGTSMLHVEEIRSQGTLRGVRVNGSLLAFLLLLNRRSQLRNGHNQLLSGVLKVGEEVVLRAFGSRLTKQEICLTNIVGSERSEKLKNSSQSPNSLQGDVSNMSSVFLQDYK